MLDLDLTLGLGALRLRVALRTEARAVALTGPSGAGKSTLLRVLAGVERRARGRVAVDGEVLQGPRVRVPAWRRSVGWVPQDATLLPHRSVRQNLALSGATDGEVRAVALELGLLPLLDRRPRHVSGGERQRVALGRALLVRPRLLLLDEPFSAMDGALREQAVRGVRRAVGQGSRLVLVTHDERLAGALGCEVWSLSAGELAPQAALGQAGSAK